MPSYWQDQRPAESRRLAELQRHLRHDEQSWNLGRTPGGSSGGAAAALAAGMSASRARLRHRRLDPRAGALLRRLRPQADLGYRARSAAPRPAWLPPPTWRWSARSRARPRTWRWRSVCSQAPTTSRRPAGGSSSRRRGPARSPDCASRLAERGGLAGRHRDRRSSSGNRRPAGARRRDRACRQRPPGVLTGRQLSHLHFSEHPPPGCSCRTISSRRPRPARRASTPTTCPPRRCRRGPSCWIIAPGSPTTRRACVLREQWKAFFADWDIVLCPAARTTAYEHVTGRRRSARCSWTASGRQYRDFFWFGLATVAHLPSTVFPTGPAADGLPIGLQAIGAEFADRTTIEFARLMAQEIGGFRPPPDYEDWAAAGLRWVGRSDDRLGPVSRRSKAAIKGVCADVWGCVRCTARQRHRARGCSNARASRSARLESQQRLYRAEPMAEVQRDRTSLESRLTTTRSRLRAPLRAGLFFDRHLPHVAERLHAQRLRGFS